MNSKYKRLTISDLITGGITDCTEDGRIFRNGKEIKLNKIKSGYKGKYYDGFYIYDLDENGQRIKIENIYKRKTKDGKEHRYESYIYKARVICAHRAVWLWNENKKNGITEIPVNFDIDHIDNNPHNNNYSNLQLMSREENLAKDRKPSTYKVRMPSKKVYTLEYIDSKIDYYVAKSNTIRSQRNSENYKEIAEKDHKIRSNIAQWKNKRKQFLEDGNSEISK